MLKRAKGKKILIGWNRGLGDIALGLYAIVHRIREFIPDAEITFITRENLEYGFSMLENVKVIKTNWTRGQNYTIPKEIRKQFDLVIEKPSPTDWVRWQRGKLTPKLKWDPAHDDLWQGFDLLGGFTYICVQVSAETEYGLWRNWPLAKWEELFTRLEKFPLVKIILFGFGTEPKFSHANVIDLRGKTTLFQLLSIVKNKVHAAILPDSGILSMIYYLGCTFPIKVISLWADSNHGILKQNVASPNPELTHYPLIGKERDLSSVDAKGVIDCIFPAEPLRECTLAATIKPAPLGKFGVIILAGGQGSRLNSTEPKGMFCIREKSLFQWILEKVPPSIPIAIMTSPFNHAETVNFFEKHECFGREVYFFQQEVMHMVSQKGEPLPILVPNGNGSVFKSFQDILAVFEKRGIDLVSIVPVENLKANPADPTFISFMRQTGCEIGIKCIERKPDDPPMGALVTREGRLEILEYMEIPPTFTVKYSYTGMLAMQLNFMKQMAKVDLPVHWVWKKAGDTFAWKGERFVFDALPFAKTAVALCFPKAEIYAPLKSEENLKEILSTTQ